MGKLFFVIKQSSITEFEGREPGSDFDPVSFYCYGPFASQDIATDFARNMDGGPNQGCKFVILGADQLAIVTHPPRGAATVEAVSG